MLKTSDIHMRDPFIFLYNEKYYLYGTTDDNCWKGKPDGFLVYVSSDLENWEEGHKIFSPSKDFWGVENFWAPELHMYREEFYIFASFKSPDRHRATSILKADNPKGPFKLWGEDSVTPREWECLDGTLYVDDDDLPWLIFCHEWVQPGGGTICARRLKEDLSGPIGEAITLFSASDANWTRMVHHSSGISGYVTDGPSMYKPKNQQLWMLWSSLTETGYGIGLAISESGNILGPYKQQDNAIFNADGGHGMIFQSKQGNNYLAIHTPNNTPDERPIFIPLKESDDTLEL